MTLTDRVQDKHLHDMRKQRITVGYEKMSSVIFNNEKLHYIWAAFLICAGWLYTSVSLTKIVMKNIRQWPFFFIMETGKLEIDLW